MRLFAFLCGVPRLVVPDNLESGVNKASFYDPEINRSYGTMAEHYGIGVLPARPKKPAARQGQGGERRPLGPELQFGAPAGPRG